ncbi:MAG TPA: hypothetical protein VGU67_02715 [Edaphobacter sp.]|nr:hypothetical protein [Edaphobacter sp.]
MQVLESTIEDRPQTEPWVNLAAVAQHIGFGPRKVAQMVKDKQIPGYPSRNGKRTFYLFKLSEVDAAIKAGRTA